MSELTREAIIQKMEDAAKKGESLNEQNQVSEGEAEGSEDQVDASGDQEDSNDNEVSLSEDQDNNSEEVESSDYGTDSHGDTAEIRELARRSGWAPQEKWKGDPKDWKPAHEFVGLGKKVFSDLKEKNELLLKKFESQEKQNKILIDSVKQLTQRHKEETKRAVEQALLQAEQERQDAILEADPQRVAEIENDMNRIRAQYQEDDSAEEPQAEDEPVDNPTFQAWVKDNDWYNTNNKAAAIADSIAFPLVQTGRFKLDDPELFEIVDQEMKIRRPDLFKDPEPEVNPNRDKPSPVSRPSGKLKKPSKARFDSLDMDDKKTYEFMVSQYKDMGETFMSKEEWAQKMLGED